MPLQGKIGTYNKPLDFEGFVLITLIQTVTA
jgi:hypothetical protein